uniref:Odorant-binding protein 7 n=1 Tax=Yemma signatus TaxID=300820 RepID=A0A3G2GRR9_9HEMI|nr:odorant-binding protein 7 [Yemma signatus]
MRSLVLLSLLVALISLVKSDPTTETVTTHDGSTVSGATVKADEARQKIKENVHALTEACKNTAKLTSDQAKIASNQGIPKTEAEKCFLDCVYQGLNITKDGKFNELAAKGLAQVRFGASQDELSKANHMIDTCAKEIVVKDTNEKCALGRLIRECFVKHGNKINFFPKP